MAGIIDSLLPSVDSILGIRDSIGAVIQPVYLVTRTWTTDALFQVPSSDVGEGYARDTEAQMLPSPQLKNFAQDLRLKEGGVIQAGDIILANISKNSYQKSDLESTTASPNIERFYRVGDKLYTVINITEKYVTWDVQIRELSNQVRYT